jgi:subtilisin family serine protease
MMREKKKKHIKKMLRLALLLSVISLANCQDIKTRIIFHIQDLDRKQNAVNDLTQYGSDRGKHMISYKPVFQAKTSKAKALGMQNIFYADFDAEIDIQRMSSQHITQIYYDQLVHTMNTPYDQYYDEQWSFKNTGSNYPSVSGQVEGCDINAEPAWKITKGSNKIIVAVLDTGVTLDHSDLPDVIEGPAFIDPPSSDDVDGHGTACAGIIAAKHNDNFIAGMCPNCKIMGVKVLGNSGTGSITGVYGGMEAAVDEGAHVLSMSLGGGGSSSIGILASQYCYDNNVPVVAAAGNDNSPVISYPAAYSQNIAIGAMSPCCERKNPGSCDGSPNWGSNYGSGLAVMAGGIFLRTTSTNGGIYSNFGGTSGATPHVAGLVGLLRSQDITLTVEDIVSLLKKGAVPIGSEFETGSGRADALNSLKLLCTPGDVNTDGTIDILDVVQMIQIIVNNGKYVTCGDVNQDGNIQITDVVLVIQLIIA